MSGCTIAHLRLLRDRHGPGPRVCVETGTYRGEGVRRALHCFETIHTIEIAPELHAAAHAEFNGRVHCHLGDSRVIVPQLAIVLKVPVFWYLDAHWFKVPGVGGRDDGLPLWDELASLATRPAGDIVAVDDVHDFGTSRPTPEWQEVTLERIAGLFPGHREAVILGDQAVIYR